MRLILILALFALGACAHVFDDAIFEKSTQETKP